MSYNPFAFVQRAHYNLPGESALTPLHHNLCYWFQLELVGVETFDDLLEEWTLYPSAPDPVEYARYRKKDGKWLRS